YLSGKLSRPRAMLLEDHTSDCSGCRGLLASARTGRLSFQPFGAPAGTGAARTLAASEPIRRTSTGRWMLAAAACMTLAVAGLVAVRTLVPSRPAHEARVRSLHGTLYRVAADGTRPVAEQAFVRYGDTLRTAKGSDAVVELADG